MNYYNRIKWGDNMYQESIKIEDREFRIGDQVLCIDIDNVPERFPQLKKEKTYTISMIRNDHLVFEETGIWGYDSFRFILLRSADTINPDE